MTKSKRWGLVRAVVSKEMKVVKVVLAVMKSKFHLK